MTRALLVAALLAAPLLLEGCGRKGLPRPPVRPAQPAAAASPVAIPTPPPGVPGQQVP